MLKKCCAESADEPNGNDAFAPSTLSKVGNMGSNSAGVLAAAYVDLRRNVVV